MPPRPQNSSRALRLLGVGLIIGLAAYWAGTHFGPRLTPTTVNAVHLPPTGTETGLDPTENENVRIYREASPSVANIVTRTVEYDFFYNPVPVEGAGSGFLIDKDGHILTNNHVVQGAQQIEVTLGDQTRETAKLIGADPRNDIALIQIDAKGHNFTPLTLGDSRNLVVGQRALAIGNPFGFSSTLTTGIISALGRTVQTSDTTFIDEAIQTDAAINRGNSGGPLLDSHGQVIGINSAIYAPNGTTAGIGFAIPINTARRVAQDLIQYGHVRRASLGAEGRPLWPQLADYLKLSGEVRNPDRESHARRTRRHRWNPRRLENDSGFAGIARRWRRGDRDRRQGNHVSDGFKLVAESVAARGHGHTHHHP